MDANILDQSIDTIWDNTLKVIDDRRLETFYITQYIADFHQCSEKKIYNNKKVSNDLKSFTYWFWHFSKWDSKVSYLIERFNELLGNKNQTWFEYQGIYLLVNLFNHFFFEKGELVCDKKRKQYLQCLTKSLEEPNSCYTQEKPSKLIVELTASCNLSCIMCGNSKQKRGFDPTKTMKIEQFEQIAEELFHSAEWIRFNGFGESTIIPNFLEYLTILDRYRSRTNFELTTNLAVRKPTIWKRLVELGCVLLVSCDGSYPELQERIRRGCSWNHFIQNLKLLKQQIKINGFPEQSLFIFTAQPENIEDLPNIVSLANQHGIYGVIVNMVNRPDGETWMDKEYKKIIHYFELASECAQEKNIDLRLPAKLGQRDIENSSTWVTAQENCMNPWQELCIRYNGDLTVCNMFNPYCYGNLFQESFEKVWNGVNARFFRGIMKEKILPPFCQNCYFLSNRCEVD